MGGEVCGRDASSGRQGGTKGARVSLRRTSVWGRARQICSSSPLWDIQRGMCHGSHAPNNASGEAVNTALEGTLARHKVGRMAEELIMVVEDE